jgi:hypothetical protein
MSQKLLWLIVVLKIFHLTYSPDLDLSDFAWFKQLKKHLEEHQFSSTDDLREIVLDVLDSLPLIFFKNAFCNSLVDGKIVQMHMAFTLRSGCS